MKKEVIAYEDSKSPISEIFRTLRTNIQFINSNKKTKTLLVTSTFPGEGKSWVASNLAVIFAQTGKKVVLVDADMRKGRQYSIFNVPPIPGLSNYLSQIGITQKKIRNKSEEIIECIRKTEVKDLYLMPAGSIPPNPSELLVSPKMLELIDKLKQAFDMIIIDGTPCELVTDAVILSRIVDSTIIVTAHKVTKKDALERVIKNIQNVGGNITGVVVNKMPITGKKYEKRYYYYGESSSGFEEKTKRRTSNSSNLSEEIKTTKISSTKTRKAEPKIQEEGKKIKHTKSSSIEKTIKTTKAIEMPKTAKTTSIPKTTRVTKTTTPKEKVSRGKKQEDRTKDILKQMNEYLEKERDKKEKEGENND